MSTLPMTSLSAAVAAVINHLLAREPWAGAKLRAHAGKIARLDAGVLAVRWQVTPDGMLQAAGDDEAENVVIRIKAADLPLILQDRQRAVSHVKVEGDADFANTVSQLSQNLQWEPEEDLSRLVGDIAAIRIMSGVRAAAATARSTHRAFSENLAEYLTEENPVLVGAQPASEFARDVVKLRDDVERLEKRIQKLKN